MSSELVKTPFGLCVSALEIIGGRDIAVDPQSQEQCGNAGKSADEPVEGLAVFASKETMLGGKHA
jgi:hypothetical protein